MIMFYKKYFRLRYIYTLSIVYCIFLLYKYRIQFLGDTVSYLAAWDMLIDGHIDEWRTPVYPLLLGCFKFFFGSSNYLLYIVLFQYFIFLISIRYFHRLTIAITKNGIISFFFTTFYALFPCIPTWNCYILTESIAISCSIFYLYSLLLLYQKNSITHWIITYFWLLFLIFLRPVFIYLLPIIFVGGILLFIKKGKSISKFIVSGLIGYAIVCILLVAYVVSFKNNYGIYSLSGISTINKYWIARMAGAVDPMFPYDPNSQRPICKRIVYGEVRKPVDVFYEAEVAISSYGLKQFSDYVNYNIKKNRSLYFKRIIRNFIDAANYSLFETSYTNPSILRSLRINLLLVYVMFLIYFIVLMKFMINKKTIALFSCLLYMIGFSHLFVIIVGSPGDYSRLILPAIPVYFIMIGQLISYFIIKNRKIFI